MKTVLVIDDDDSLRKVIEFTLRQDGYRVVACSSGQDGLRVLSQKRPDLIITDMQLGDLTGVDILKKAISRHPDLPVIVITAHGSIDNAVEAMKLGASEYLLKPFSCDQLRVLTNKAARQMLTNLGVSSSRTSNAAASLPVISQSDKMQTVMALVRRVAARNSTALILGESGTGKELVARTLHHSSKRAGGPFVAVNCAAIPRDLLESELFGHLRGAFTGAVKDRLGRFRQAAGGTLFLDEIGELPLELQPKLLRALQERIVEPVGGESLEVDVRVVAATNLDIETMVKKGTFREDLYYRLAVVPITLPPLRQRREDIAVLFRHFLNKYTEGAEVTVTEEALECLRNYDWPGNVRELENVAERTLILCPYPVIEVNHLPPQVRLNNEIRFGGVVNLPRDGYPLETLEREAITQALLLNEWNQSRTADFLQVPRHVLTYRMEKYQIKRA